MSRFLLNAALSTHQGRQRRANEDAIDYRYPSDLAVLETYGAAFVVADGVGGMSGGKRASELAVELILKTYYSSTLSDPTARMVEAFQTANLALHNTPDIGATTASALVLWGDQFLVAYVGDTSVYWVQGQHIHKITEEHLSFAKSAKGVSPRLTRALGHKEQVVVDTVVGTVAVGDRLLLVTDGVTRYFDAQQIALACDGLSPQETAETLIRGANDAGGIDNISVAAIDIGVYDPAALSSHIDHFSPIFTISNEKTSPTPATEPVNAKPPEQRAKVTSNKVRFPLSLIAVGVLILLLAGMGVLLVDRADTEADAGSVPTLTSTVTHTPTHTIQATNTPSPSASPTVTASLTASITPTDSPTPTATFTATASLTASPSATQEQGLRIGIRIHFSQSELTYRRVDSDVVSFTVVPGQEYIVRDVYVEGTVRWYRLQLAQSERYGWITEQNLPDYEIVTP